MASSEAALWQQRLLRFVLGGAAPLIAGALGVLRNKWLATHLEATGFGVIAQVMAAQNWTGTLAGLGLGLPIARALGSAAAARDDREARRALWTAIDLILPCVVAAAALVLLFAPRISEILLGTPSHATSIRIASAGMAGVAMNGLLQGVFAGRSDVRGPIASTSAGGLVALLAAIAFVPRFGIVGGVLATSLLFPAAVLGGLVLRRGALAGIVRPRERFDRTLATSLLELGAASLGLALADQGAMLAVRSHYLRIHGIESNGWFQAAFALSQQLSGLFYAYLASHAFGRISGRSDIGGVREYTRRLWSPILGLAAIAFATAMLAAQPLLRLLYSEAFDPSRPMMAWTLVGEFARVAVQVWSLGALVVGGIRLWVPIGITNTLAMPLAYAWLTWAGAGALALPLASALGGVAAIAFTAVAMSRRGVTVTPFQGGLLVIGLAGLAALALRVAQP